MAAATTTTNATPTDAILTSLQQILDAWEDGSDDKVIEGCTTLLKRKKIMNNLGLIVPLQRLWFQSLLQQEKFTTLLSSIDMVKGPTDLDAPSYLQDLVLYAKYRQEEYNTVAKQASKSTSSSSSSSLSNHLSIQSQFHLNQSTTALEGYRTMMKEKEDEDDPDPDDDAVATDERFQILTNALAVIASSTQYVVPYVSLITNNQNDNDNNKDDVVSFFMEEATKQILENDNDDDETTDLAGNLGILQFLTDQSLSSTTSPSPSTDYLQLSYDSMTGDDDGNNKKKTDDTNLVWRRHFWFRDIDDIRYSSKSSTASGTISVSQTVATINQALIDEQLRNIPSQPHTKFNALLIRLYWYNRAVLQFKAKQYVECQESCQSLRKALQQNSSSSSSSGTGGANARKKNKKTTKTSDGGTTSIGKSSSSSSSSDLWWESRIDVVMAYVQNAQSKSSNEEALARLDQRMEQLVSSQSSSTTMNQSEDPILDYAIAYVQLHRFVIEHGPTMIGGTKQTKKLVSLLKTLPTSIQDRPAVKLTLDDLETAVLKQDGSNAGTTTTTTGNSTTSTPLLEQADLAFSQGRYHDACELYEENLASSTDDEEEHVDRQLRYIQALTLTGQTEKSSKISAELSSLLDEATGVSLPDGSVLESKGLPRNMTVSVGKQLISSTKESEEGNGSTAQDPSSRDKVMRRRARKREEYLKDLEAKGLYNPDRPTKPNPERWIPKHERSRSRGGGGRNNRKTGNSNNNRSAQGGGSQLDAQRLDAAARKAGKVPMNSGPSTANVKVSGGGGRKGGRKR